MAEVKTAVERRKASALRSARAASADAAPVLRLSALRLPSLLFGGKYVGLALHKTRTRMRRENEIAFLSAPR
jgi:hypothetical protein